MKQTLISALLAGTLGTFALTVQAAPEFCSAVTTHADGLSVSDMTFNSVNANDCYGIVPGNINEENYIPGGGPPPDATTWLNSTVGATWGDEWEYLVSDGAGGGATSGDFGGYSFALTAGTGTSGSWDLTVTPTDGLPIFLSFIGILKASDRFGMWLFNDRQVNADNSGTFTISFENNGDQNPALSHLDLWVRAGEEPPEEEPPEEEPPEQTVPEPGTLALLGGGLLALWALRRRKENA